MNCYEEMTHADFIERLMMRESRLLCTSHLVPRKDKLTKTFLRIGPPYQECESRVNYPDREGCFGGFEKIIEFSLL
jgi:hypothetical protein